MSWGCLAVYAKYGKSINKTTSEINSTQCVADECSTVTSHMSFSSPEIAAVKNKLFCFPLLLLLHFSPVPAGDAYVPCKLVSAYSSPFMAFTWLLLNRANPNSWEKTEQEMASYGGDV